MSIIFLNSSLVKLAYGGTQGSLVAVVVVVAVAVVVVVVKEAIGSSACSIMLKFYEILFLTELSFFPLSLMFYKNSDTIEVLNFHFTIFLQRNN